VDCDITRFARTPGRRSERYTSVATTVIAPMGLEGRPPESILDESGARASIRSYRWQPHCRGLYQTPMAA
jgi:hypothetical protein